MTAIAARKPDTPIEVGTLSFVTRWLPPPSSPHFVGVFLFGDK
jgi:hypothetical protein